MLTDNTSITLILTPTYLKTGGSYQAKKRMNTVDMESGLSKPAFTEEPQPATQDPTANAPSTGSDSLTKVASDIGSGLLQTALGPPTLPPPAGPDPSTRRFHRGDSGSEKTRRSRGRRWRRSKSQKRRRSPGDQTKKSGGLGSLEKEKSWRMKYRFPNLRKGF